MEENKSFHLYPNPVYELLTITAFHIRNISIFDMLGNVILEKDYPPGSKHALQLNLSGLLPGAYFIRAGNEVERFVKL